MLSSLGSSEILRFAPLRMTGKKNSGVAPEDRGHYAGENSKSD